MIENTAIGAVVVLVFNVRTRSRAFKIKAREQSGRPMFF